MVILFVSFYPYRCVRTILSTPFDSIPFCLYTTLLIPFCPYRIFRYNLVLEPYTAMLYNMYLKRFQEKWFTTFTTIILAHNNRFTDRRSTPKRSRQKVHRHRVEIHGGLMKKNSSYVSKDVNDACFIAIETRLIKQIRSCTWP